MILVDTSVVIDILGGDPIWSAWSAKALADAGANDPLAINDVVYAELAAGFENAEHLSAALDQLRLSLVRIPLEALFLAGHAFRRYRRSGGTRSSILSDFFIGAHAAVTGATLLTRDARRVRSYFPTVALAIPAG